MPLFGQTRPPAGLRPLCYGKLPLARDFLISRGGDASRAFQDWLNHLDRTGSPATLPRRIRVLFRPAAGDSVVAASLWDSADLGGVRRFPFSLYAEVPQEALDASEACPFLFALPVCEALENEYAALIATDSPESFHERLRRIKLPSADRLAASGAETRRRHADTLTASALEAALFGPEARGALRTLFDRVIEAIGENGGGAVRLPLADEIPYHVQASGWIEFVRERAGASQVPSVISPVESSGEAKATLVLLWRPLRQSDVRLLQGIVGNADVVDLAMRGPSD